MNGNEFNVYHLRTVKTEREVVDQNGNKKTIKVGGVPYATVAIDFNSDGTVNRGISICSPKDDFVGKTGIDKAVGRMRKAKKCNSNILPIFGFKRLESKIEKKFGRKIAENVDFDFLGYANASPNDIEKKIFKKELGTNL